MRSSGLIVAALTLALAGSASIAAAPPATPKPAPKPAPAATPTPAVAPEAVAALRRMSTYLQTLPTVGLTSKASLEVVTERGQRIQLDGVVRYKIRRPDGFRIEAVSDQRQRTYFYDGKTFTLYAPKLGYYATAPAPATIRQTLAVLESRFGVELPLEDLFRWNDPSENLAQNLTSGFYVGSATLDGVEVDQYAFRQPKVDWQIWIQRGPRPLPLKVVIVDQVDPAFPAYTARLSWTTDQAVTPSDFTFRPGKGAKLIRLSEVAK